MNTMEMIMIMIDECGDEREIARFRIGDDLDEDYIEVWKDMKLDWARDRYPEARGFYFEDRRKWQSTINAMVNGFFGGSYDYEDEWD